MTTASGPRPAPEHTLVSVILPVLNEAGVLRTLAKSIDDAFDKIGCRYELIFVNDGSADGSAAILDEMGAVDARVRVLHLSRNFGQQAAVQAGLTHSAGDAIIVMDADRQDDPGALHRLVERWRDGYDVVYAVRVARQESAAKRFLSAGFYRVLAWITRPSIPENAGNFGLVDRAVAQTIARVPDCDRYFPGLRSWAGYSQIGVPIARGARYDARPRVSIRGLWRLAKTAIFSFSSVPLTMFYAIFALSALTFVCVGGFAMYHKLVTGLAIPGWTSTIMTACFFGALNALGIGILGEYISRIYDQVRGRPVFVIARRVNFAQDAVDRPKGAE
jgi:dolichol-phosphate mannosyltransferase